MSSVDELMEQLQSPPLMRSSGSGFDWPTLRAWVKCQDGFEMSVQASESHYCRPRNNDGGYSHFEVGFPSVKEPLLSPYAVDTEKEPMTVYGYVPIDVIRQVIEKHGGPKQKGGKA